MQLLCICQWASTQAKSVDAMPHPNLQQTRTLAALQMQVIVLSLCDCLMQTYPWGANALPEDRKLTQKIIGNYSGPGGDLTPVPDFYHMFAVEHNKPMAICETGAMFNTQADATVDAYHMKIKWLEQVTTQHALPFTSCGCRSSWAYSYPSRCIACICSTAKVLRCYVFGYVRAFVCNA